MPHIVYILFSSTLNSYYIGFTSDITARLKRHNQKGKGFTGKVNDWELVYQEAFSLKLLSPKTVNLSRCLLKKPKKLTPRADEE